MGTLSLGKLIKWLQSPRWQEPGGYRRPCPYPGRYLLPHHPLPRAGQPARGCPMVTCPTAPHTVPLLQQKPYPPSLAFKVLYRVAQPCSAKQTGPPGPPINTLFLSGQAGPFLLPTPTSPTCPGHFLQELIPLRRPVHTLSPPPACHLDLHELASATPAHTGVTSS